MVHSFGSLLCRLVLPRFSCDPCFAPYSCGLAGHVDVSADSRCCCSGIGLFRGLCFVEAVAVSVVWLFRSFVPFCSSRKDC